MHYKKTIKKTQENAHISIDFVMMAIMNKYPMLPIYNLQKRRNSYYTIVNR